MSIEEVKGEVKETVKEKVKKPFYKKIWFWIVVVLVVAVASSGSSDEGQTTVAESSDNESKNKTDVVEEVEEEIVYTPYTVAQMQSDLESNALKAESTYNNQYVEITGALGTIDSDGKYISLLPLDDEWAILGITCNITNEEQKAQVIEMSVGETVTLRGKVTSVGEVLGYELDIDSIN